MRSTGTPRMRATVGFCAVACICRPVRVPARNHCSSDDGHQRHDQHAELRQRNRHAGQR